MNPAAFPGSHGSWAADSSSALTISRRYEEQLKILLLFSDDRFQLKSGHFNGLVTSKDAHSKRLARSSLGETTTPRNRSLVVDLHAIHCG